MLFLDHYSSLTISFLTPLVKAAQEAGKGALMRFHKGGIKYEVSYFAGDSFFSFMWTYQGKQYRQQIGFITEPSHIQGEVRFFICPATGHKCRKLYFGRKSIFSRYAVRHVYSYQHLSHSTRIFANARNPKRKHGRPKYKGKTTRYGKRIDRYNLKLLRINEYVSGLFDKQQIVVHKKV